MNVIAYLVLLIILLVVLCIIGILAVTFHTCILSWCCTKYRSGSESASETSGRRNIAFNDQDEEAVIRPRPFNSMEQVETPPSYEEAVRQELFRFRPPQTPFQRSKGENLNQRETAQPVAAASLSTPSTSAHNQPVPSSSPSNQRHRMTRARTSTACSSTSANLHLTTIDEEEDECPIQVVIDCIGVQAARLIENCDTKVQLTNGHELKTNSTC